MMGADAINMILPRLVGKTVRSVAFVEEDRCDDILVVAFEDGSRLTVQGFWCNDRTGALTVNVEVGDETHD